MNFTQDQQAAFDKFIEFLDSTAKVFILNGYAGTGKTTMIKYFTEHLKSISFDYQLMAPTGRAAKVLRDKVGEAYTIHKTIYNYSDLQCLKTEAKDDSEKSYHFVFPVRMTCMEPILPKVAIIDESSMISDTASHHEFFSFGSGKLLSDLLQYAANVGIGKLVFVGDNAQLPPVTDNHSSALDPNYFKDLGTTVMTAEMKNVVRQTNESGILQTANEIRTLLKKPLKERSFFTIEPNGSDMIELDCSGIYDKYLEMFPKPKFGNGVIINYSNAQCYMSNSIIRERMYGNKCDVKEGDILLINNNNYHTFGKEIFNGDMARVIEVGAKEDAQIPVTRNGERKVVKLEFKHLTLLFPDSDIPIKCIVYYPLLFNRDAEITAWEQQALYIYFKIRNPKLKEGSEEFKDALKKDLYFNVLKVKFGYAITCHKAQGGEWDNVIVDYSMRTGTNDDMLRWCYTATTRAKERLYMLFPPQVTPFSKLKILPIVKTSKCPSDFFSGMDVETSFHKDRSDRIPVAVKFKCLSIVEALKDTPFTLVGIESFNYRERLSVQYQEDVYKVDLVYNSSGICNPLPVNGDSPQDILHLVINNAKVSPEYILYYNPSTRVCRSLYNRIQSLAEECDIKIVSIIEDLSKYKVSFNIITDARFATIVFYINNKGFITTAIPSSELGESDTKFKQMIDSLRYETV